VTNRISFALKKCQDSSTKIAKYLQVRGCATLPHQNDGLVGDDQESGSRGSLDDFQPTYCGSGLFYLGELQRDEPTTPNAVQGVDRRVIAMAVQPHERIIPAPVSRKDVCHGVLPFCFCRNATLLWIPFS
jgi:hypothetical protein